MKSSRSNGTKSDPKTIRASIWISIDKRKPTWSKTHARIIVRKRRGSTSGRKDNASSSFMFWGNRLRAWFFAGYWLILGGSWRPAKLTQKSMPKSSQHHRKMRPGGSRNPSKIDKWLKNHSQIYQNGAQERSENDLGSQLVLGAHKGRTIIFEKMVLFRRRLADLGRHFGPS